MMDSRELERTVRQLRADQDAMRREYERAIPVRFGATGGKGSGSFPLIHFTIDTAECANGTATATIDNVPCGCSSPSIGDSIEVADLYGWFAGETNPTLNGRGGWAIKMQEANDLYGECNYVIQSLDPSVMGC